MLKISIERVKLGFLILHLSLLPLFPFFLNSLFPSILPPFLLFFPSDSFPSEEMIPGELQEEVSLGRPLLLSGAPTCSHTFLPAPGQSPVLDAAVWNWEPMGAREL